MSSLYRPVSPTYLYTPIPILLLLLSRIGRSTEADGISADHVDILGATPLNEAILKIASGRGDLVEDKIESGILEYVEKMKWD